MSRTRVMGIVNVTPDSFSDGGEFFEPRQAANHALQLVRDGADVLDFGAESTRPGHTPVSAGEEQERLLEALELFRREAPDAIVSVDTRHLETAEVCLERGLADAINWTGGGIPPAAAAAARFSAGLALMRIDGGFSPQGMLAAAVEAGCSPEAVLLDPGIGFTASREEDLGLVKSAASHAREFNLLLGVSRKRVLRYAARSETVADIDALSSAAALAALASGFAMVRVHNVAATVQAFRIWNAFQTEGK